MQSITSVLQDYQNAAYRELKLGYILSANCYVYCYNRLSLEVDNERMLWLEEDKDNRTWHILNLHAAYSRLTLRLSAPAGLAGFAALRPASLRSALGAGFALASARE